MTAVSPRIPRLRVRERQWFAGNPFKRLTDGIVNPPVYHASTIVFPTLAALEGRMVSSTYPPGRDPV